MVCTSVPFLKWSYKKRCTNAIVGVPIGGSWLWRVKGSSWLRKLSRRARATTVPVRDRQRAEIILLSAQGLAQQRIAEQLGISRLCVNRWVGRFALRRLQGLSDRAGRGRKPWLPQAAVQQVLEQAVTPPPHLGRWSCRTMA